MKEFVEYIVKNLVDNPDSVDVQCFEGERGMIIEVRVAQPDIGKVVGSRGRTIKALRTVVMTVCARLGKRARLELIE
jgi:predicted RNA-binding protein YlqC (UPF0109 family)